LPGAFDQSVGSNERQSPEAHLFPIALLLHFQGMGFETEEEENNALPPGHN
jgi:hypothetical protein